MESFSWKLQKSDAPPHPPWSFPLPLFSKTSVMVCIYFCMLVKMSFQVRWEIPDVYWNWHPSLTACVMKWTCWLWHWPGTQKLNDSTQGANERVMVQARTRIRRKWQGTSWRIQKLRVCFCPVYFLANTFPQPVLPFVFFGALHIAIAPPIGLVHPLACCPEDFANYSWDKYGECSLWFRCYHPPLVFSWAALLYSSFAVSSIAHGY